MPNTPMSRRAFASSLAGSLLLAGPLHRLTAGAPRREEPGERPRPSRAQLRWQREELALFCHFGVNTFTDREWGEGTEDPSLFAPAALDCRQWARAAKAAGFRTLILTAKHHDGFCLWPSSVTRHSVASSTWRGGQGDVVREFTAACRAEQLGAGLYLSPWDRNAPSYGSGQAYNEFYVAQLTELLTRYGPIVEVWFDGANGEGPNGRRQAYDWPVIWGTVKRLQPDAVIFSDAGPDVRWIGNETGSAGDPDWSTVDPAAVPYPGASGDAVTAMLQHGDPHGSVWRPGETDVSIRPGWFYHPAEDGRVKSPDELVELYFSSVGRNSKLLLNVPPTREGRLHDTDVARLSAMHDQLTAGFVRNLAHDQPVTFQRAGADAASQELALHAVDTLTAIRLEENIERGQRVARYTVEGADETGAWTELCRGETIGYCKLDRPASAAKVGRLRITFACVEDPLPLRVAAYGATSGPMLR